ncbi:MAG: flagellar biosynthesis anti-sigma factor FlgM [Acidobacteria bacterium]|nr:flagellar biosynthesis anti-sigma factor FlgM [Acidobacteriota bacterium]HQZ37911.1 flagellar biosynthesis anti-sigma factor FlgM [Vicinamibacterales bacterium]
MKIDTNRTNLDSLGTVKPDATDAAAPSSATRTGQAGRTDEVQLSPGVQLAGAAVKAAAGAPDVRPAEVERARALLESGKLGADPYSLADVLIDLAVGEK